MIKGIIALFTSGIIFRPLVLLGIISGFYIMLNMESDDIHNLFYNPLFYGALYLVTLIYRCAFKRVYFNGGSRVNWNATLSQTFGEFMSLLIAIIFSCLFIFTVSFGGGDEVETHLQSNQDLQLKLQEKQQQLATPPQLPDF